MFRRSVAAHLESVLPAVYSAAVAASADTADAAAVTGRVLRGGAGGDRRALVERALLHAVRSAPHPAFVAMMPGEREVVVLARLARYTVPEIASALGLAESDVRARMLSGLRRATVAAVA